MTCNVTFELSFRTNLSAPGDNVHWNIIEPKLELTFNSFDLRSTSLEQEVIFKTKIVQDAINTTLTGLTPTIQKLLETEVDSINKIILDESEYTFVVPLKYDNQSLNLNLTLTEQPTV